MRKIRLTRKNRRAIFLYLMIITIIVLVWINYHSSQIKVLYAEGYEESIQSNALIIRNESLITLNQNIDFAVEEGKKVSINEVLSQSGTSGTNNYYSDEIKSINYILDNNLYQDSNLFDKDLQEIEEKITNIDKELDGAKLFSNQDKINDLESQKKELVDKKDEILEFIKYIGSDKETLQELKEKYSNYLNDSGGAVTLKNLHFNYPGYVYFHCDGYENTLDPNILEYITPDYIDNLEQYKRINNTNTQIIKVIDDSFMYFVVKLPTETPLVQQDDALDIKNKLMDQIETKSLNTYYEYLNKRVDILRQFPKVTMDYEKVRGKGYLIDSKDYGEYSLNIIEIKEEIPKKLLEDRWIPLNIYTYSEQGYLIPQKSIVDIDGKSNIVVMNKGFLKKYIQVNVSKVNKDTVFLKSSDNEEIHDGLQLIINP